jgi:hypothetical protein
MQEGFLNANAALARPHFTTALAEKQPYRELACELLMTTKMKLLSR